MNVTPFDTAGVDIDDFADRVLRDLDVRRAGLGDEDVAVDD